MFARFFPRSVGQFCKQHGLHSTEQFLHGFNNLQKLASLPISPISNSYVTMSLAAFSLSLDISDFRKQFKTVFVITASQAAITFAFLVANQISAEFFSSQHFGLSSTYSIVTVLCFQWVNHKLIHFLSLRSYVRWKRKQLDWF